MQKCLAPAGDIECVCDNVVRSLSWNNQIKVHQLRGEIPKVHEISLKSLNESGELARKWKLENVKIEGSGGGRCGGAGNDQRGKRGNRMA